MTVFVKPSIAPQPRNLLVRFLSVGLAGVFVIMALAQLFTFDELVEVIPALGLPLAGGFEYALIPLIVAAEVFALPFLLTMTVSVAFRWLSMFCGWFVAAAWVIISGYLLVNSMDVVNTGIVGMVVEVGGVATFIVGLALTVLVAWASWGLWPARSRAKVIEK